jgi:hypothetical protein
MPESLYHEVLYLTYIQNFVEDFVDLLKRAQSEGAIWDDVSVNKRAGIPSGP